MASVLFVKANDRPAEQAVSVKMYNTFLKTYKELHPQDTIRELDLFGEELPYYGDAAISGLYKAAHGLEAKAMKKFNKKRLITLATPALQAEDDRKNLSTVLPRILAKIFLPNGYAEMKKLEGIVKHSDMDWTVVRIINPNVKYKEQSYDYSFGDRPGKMSVSRENVAKLMYAAARQNQLIGKMPIVYNK